MIYAIIIDFNVSSDNFKPYFFTLNSFIKAPGKELNYTSGERYTEEVQIIVPHDSNSSS